MKRRTVRGLDLSTLDAGQGNAVVLVHGFPLNHEMWNAQIDALSSRYRVIAPDLRGFGQSDVTDGTVTMEDYADDLAELLDALSIHEPVVLCGLSMGGYIALEFWRRHRARLKALVLCDTRAAADSSEAAAGRQATADRVLQEGTAFLAETLIPRLFATADRSPEPAWVQATRAVIQRTDPRGVAAAARGMAGRADFIPFVGQIRVPSLLVVGQHDAITPPDEMRQLARAMPQASLVEISAAGHMAPLENPAQTNAAILAFLAETTESEPATGS